MIGELHFLRPWWLLSLLPLIALAILLWRQTPRLRAWSEICDSHLLAHLLQNKGHGKRMHSLLLLFLSAVFMILALSGPSWYKLPVPIYKSIAPRVLILDMSEAMQETDLSPNRLSRAKFKLRDLFAHKEVGQFGLVVFTGEPFVVSPLTDDGQTISSLLSSLTPEIMPVNGQNLYSALLEAKTLIKEAGYKYGQILVLTASAPSAEAIQGANNLAQKGIYSSIMPMTANKEINPLYQRFADSGKGELIMYSAEDSDLDQWLSHGGKEEELSLNKDDDIPLWRDEGRWFLIPALMMLLPVFRRGWLQRVAV